MSKTTSLGPVLESASKRKTLNSRAKHTIETSHTPEKLPTHRPERLHRAHYLLEHNAEHAGRPEGPGAAPDCHDAESCAALAEEYAHEADALRASIAELSDELQQAKLERIENNILEFVEEQPSAPNQFRTTLRGLDGGDTAFLRAQWTFLESGGCTVTPASGRDSATTREAGGAGWRLMPAKVQGPQRDKPDIFECWCFVKDGRMVR